jgi:hypothetical protein
MMRAHITSALARLGSASASCLRTVDWNKIGLSFGVFRTATLYTNWDPVTDGRGLKQRLSERSPVQCFGHDRDGGRWHVEGELGGELSARAAGPRGLAKVVPTYHTYHDGYETNRGRDDTSGSFWEPGAAAHYAYRASIRVSGTISHALSAFITEGRRLASQASQGGPNR